jgi:hypothetical protein
MDRRIKQIKRCCKLQHFLMHKPFLLREWRGLNLLSMRFIAIKICFSVNISLFSCIPLVDFEKNESNRFETNLSDSEIPAPTQIENDLCNQCLLPLKLWVRTVFMVRCTRWVRTVFMARCTRWVRTVFMARCTRWVRTVFMTRCTRWVRTVFMVRCTRWVRTVFMARCTRWVRTVFMARCTRRVRTVFMARCTRWARTVFMARGTRWVRTVFMARSTRWVRTVFTARCTWYKYYVMKFVSDLRWFSPPIKLTATI